MTLEGLSEGLKVFLQLAQVATILFAVYKFTRKPHDTHETRITTLEVEMKEQKFSLKQGNDRFREQESTNEVMQTCMLALLDFELAYCIHTNYEDTEDLIKAKDILRKHLARK